MITGATPSELLSPADAATADRLAAGRGVPVSRLMEAAGWAVARAARRMGRARTLVLCGPGNNGGDGAVAARILAEWGWPVELALLAPPRPGSAAAGALARWRGPVRPFSPDAAARAGLVIDAVFGAGLTRDVDGLAAETLRAARRLLAVDVPSGLDGATGQARGFAPQAEVTVTFFRLKPGHLLLPGRGLCGTVLLADIGLPETVLPEIGADTWRNGPALWRLPPLGAEGHKYSRGHVTVLGGAAMTGAARLAAGAARRGGAGMVSIAAAEGAAIYRSGAPGLIVTDKPLPELLEDARRTVWVCGPGLGPDQARRALPVLVEAGRQVVGDADVFTAFAGQPAALRGCAVVTPHEGEFARLFGPVQGSKLEAARAASRQIGAVVVLKGADTVIAAPDGRAAINDSAPPCLATAGAGDVLSGLVAALLARGMAAWEAASAAVYLHGRAGVIAGATAGAGLLAEDLLPAIPRALSEIAG